MEVIVKNNNIDQALRVLRTKVQREGILKTFKAQSRYTKPSDEKRENQEKIKRRWNKQRQKDILKTGESRKPKFG